MRPGTMHRASVRRKLQVRQGTLPMLLLLVTLALAGGLAYHAYDAARSHRQTAENTLRDYASFAAWGFVSRSSDLLHTAFWEALAPARTLSPASSPRTLPPPTILNEVDLSYLFTPHTLFRADFGTRRIEVVGDTHSTATLMPLIDSIASRASETEHPDHGMLPIRDGDRADLVAYWIVRDRHGAPLAGYGIVVEGKQLSNMFTRCSRDNLLPTALAGEQPTDSLLYLTVSWDGSTFYESPMRYETAYAAADTLGGHYAGLTVQAAIRPDAAADLIIGGLPRSRLPLVLGLLMLTVGVGVAALLQIRRERELARLRDDFVSGVSHELRTPLAQIRMFGELLNDGKLRTVDERKRSTSVINREARRLTHLVENILHFSRLRRSTERLTFEETDVRAVIGETIEAFSPLAQAKDVHLAEQIDDELIVSADRDALSQILLNLLDNALKYGPAGQTVTVGLQAVHGVARVTVDDEGPGIPEKDRNKIWKSYRRLDRDANTTVVGSGIGLAVVAELAELHGGRAWVEAAPSGGARFVIEFPGAREKPSTGDRPDDTRRPLADSLEATV